MTIEFWKNGGFHQVAVWDDGSKEPYIRWVQLPHVNFFFGGDKWVGKT